jgi:adenylosuccinate synthase
VAASASLSVAESTTSTHGPPSRIASLSQVSGVLGSQWGDEGKGKLVDILAEHFDIVARCQVSLTHTNIYMRVLIDFGGGLIQI